MPKSRASRHRTGSVSNVLNCNMRWVLMPIILVAMDEMNRNEMDRILKSDKI